MSKVVHSLVELVGKTPLYRSKSLSQNGSDVLIKLEMFNPMKHMRDRTAKGVVEYAEQAGIIFPDTELIDAASGSYGLSLAFYTGAKGYRLSMVVPEDASQDYINLLKAMDVTVIFSDASLGLVGATSLAEEIASNNADSYVMLRGLESHSNKHIHQTETGPEIWTQTEGKVDVLVSSYYSGGFLSGVGAYLREQNPNLKVVLVEPEESAVYSGKTPTTHKIADAGPGFHPSLLDNMRFDHIVSVSEEKVIQCQRKLATKEGLYLGYAGSLQAYVAGLYTSIYTNKCIVTCAPTYGERFISTLGGNK